MQLTDLIDGLQALLAEHGDHEAVVTNGVGHEFTGSLSCSFDFSYCGGEPRILIDTDLPTAKDVRRQVLEEAAQICEQILDDASIKNAWGYGAEECVARLREEASK